MLQAAQGGRAGPRTTKSALTAVQGSRPALLSHHRPPRQQEQTSSWVPCVPAPPMKGHF